LLSRLKLTQTRSDASKNILTHVKMLSKIQGKSAKLRKTLARCAAGFRKRLVGDRQGFSFGGNKSEAARDDTLHVRSHSFIRDKKVFAVAVASPCEMAEKDQNRESATISSVATKLDLNTVLGDILDTAQWNALNTCLASSEMPLHERRAGVQRVIDGLAAAKGSLATPFHEEAARTLHYVLCANLDNIAGNTTSQEGPNVEEERDATREQTEEVASQRGEVALVRDVAAEEIVGDSALASAAPALPQRVAPTETKADVTIATNSVPDAESKRADMPALRTKPVSFLGEIAAFNRGVLRSVQRADGENEAVVQQKFPSPPPTSDADLIRANLKNVRRAVNGDDDDDDDDAEEYECNW